MAICELHTRPATTHGLALDDWIEALLRRRQSSSVFMAATSAALYFRSLQTHLL
jgi:hypothetical protein